MKILMMHIEHCNKCPFFIWEENNSCSNHSGWSKCNKENRYIERDTAFPEFPSWCPLKDENT